MPRRSTTGDTLDLVWVETRTDREHIWLWWCVGFTTQLAWLKCSVAWPTPIGLLPMSHDPGQDRPGLHAVLTNASWQQTSRRGVIIFFYFFSKMTVGGDMGGLQPLWLLSPTHKELSMHLLCVFDFHSVMGNPLSPEHGFVFIAFYERTSLGWPKKKPK